MAVREPSKSAHAFASAARRLFHHDPAGDPDIRLLDLGNMVDAFIATDLIEKWFASVEGHKQAPARVIVLEAHSIATR